MRAAVADLDGGDALHLDFYDRTRMTDGVGDYPGEILWVKERIGQPLPGWRPYGNWSRAPDPADSAYLSDDSARLWDQRNPQDGPLKIGDGIARLRSILSRPGGVVRLTGLSGTGKTRLLEALFDPQIGDQALDHALAVYTDIGAEAPQPRVGQLANRLTAEGTSTTTRWPVVAWASRINCARQPSGVGSVPATPRMAWLIRNCSSIFRSSPTRSSTSPPPKLRRMTGKGRVQSQRTCA